jgi:hypothetical protein
MMFWTGMRMRRRPPIAMKAADDGGRRLETACYVRGSRQNDASFDEIAYCCLMIFSPPLCIDELPSTPTIGTLRKAGVVSRDDTHAYVVAGDVEATVRVCALKTRAGPFSLFECPSCDRLAMKLRAYEGRLVCRRCALAAGLQYRIWVPLHSRPPRAQMQVERLREKLARSGTLGEGWRRGRASRYEMSFILNEHKLRRQKLGEMAPDGLAKKIETP